jgi:hypothetical protein
MPLSRRQKYDYRDIDRRELKLIRIGHYLWGLYKREVAGKCRSVDERDHIYEALETVWQLKRQLRIELKAERAARFKEWRGQ